MSFYAIFKKESKNSLTSWTTYTLIAVFLIMAGFFFYSDLVFFEMWLGQNIQEGLWQYFFHDVRLIMFLMIPLLTMNTFAEEKKSGTVELLFTFPLKDGAILMGKFFNCLLIFMFMIGLTLLYPVILYGVHRFDIIPVLVGYLGLFLLGGAFISIGIFVSSLTESPIIAAFITFIALMVFWYISWNEGIGSEAIVNILMGICLYEHFYSFARGIIETKDVVFNILFTTFFLFLSMKSLDSRKWKGSK